jgi:DMSO/TMAO reductase YedYZ molybdopterin-dependent catalytic subunit
MSHSRHPPSLSRALARRAFLRGASAGTVVTAFGGAYTLATEAEAARASDGLRADGRTRLPPGQRLLDRFKPMGGTPGDPSKSKYRLRIHGAVSQPFEVDLRGLLSLPQVEQRLDVHCVTGWTVLGARLGGVRIKELADRARLAPEVKYVIFEAPGGYTANVRLEDALAPDCLVAHRLDGQPLARPHGAPARAIIPDLYFWKSAKWLTGIRFVSKDEPGYWETRGYHNHADPWLEERYSFG